MTLVMSVVFGSKKTLEVWVDAAACDDLYGRIFGDVAVGAPWWVVCLEALLSSGSGVRQRRLRGGCCDEGMIMEGRQYLCYVS